MRIREDGLRVVNLDGEEHVEGFECCDGVFRDAKCSLCKRRTHVQPAYGCLIYSCEHCDPVWRSSE